MASRSCEFSESLTAYLDGELPIDARNGIEAHLPGCDACRSELVLLRGTLARVADAERIEPSPGLRRLVLNSLDAERGIFASLRSLLRARFLVPAGAFATVAVVAAVVIGVRPARTEHRRSVEFDVASRLDLLEDLDVVSAIDVPPDTTAEDIDLVAHLDELKP